jgi:hypothetical protein
MKGWKECSCFSVSTVTQHSKWTESYTPYTTAGHIILIGRIWNGSCTIFVSHILSSLFSGVLDHMAVGQADVNYSLPKGRHLFIVLHK